MNQVWDSSENVLAVTNEADYFRENAPYITTKIWLTSTDLKNIFNLQKINYNWLKLLIFVTKLIDQTSFMLFLSFITSSTTQETVLISSSFSAVLYFSPYRNHLYPSCQCISLEPDIYPCLVKVGKLSADNMSQFFLPPIDPFIHHAHLIYQN